MVRGILVCLCFLGLLFAQSPKEQNASEQPATAGQSAPAEPAQVKTEPATPNGNSEALASEVTTKTAVPSANAQFPLDAFKNFSAQVTGNLAGGDEEANLYRLGNLMRSDLGKSGYYNITDMIKGDTYGVTPDGCLHDPHPHFRIFPFRVAMNGAKVERVVTGKETLDGHSCTIEDVTVLSPGPPLRKLRMKFWEAEDLQGFPIKIQVMRPGGNSVDILYSKVILTPPAATLFKHPTKCQVLSNGGLPGASIPPGK